MKARILAVIGAVGLLSGVLSQVGTAPALASCSWVEVPSAPLAVDDSGGLSAVIAFSSTDAWAVGSQSLPDFTGGTLVERWDGTSWSVVPSPNAGALDNTLDAIAGLSPRDIWAVGQFAENSTTAGPLIEHWNGGMWKVVPSPDVPAGILTGVAAVSRSDAWAVGSGGEGSLVEHWDGKAWTAQSVPQVDISLSDISRVPGTNELWAVGFGNYALHFDGSSWSAVPLASDTSQGQSVDAVASVSPTDVWAVGQPDLAEHWDGTSWSIVKQGTSLFPAVILNDVAVASPASAWAVGDKEIKDFDGARTEHWNGSSWNVVSNPESAAGFAGGGVLNGVATVPGTRQVWAVGEPDGSPLIMRRC